MKENFFSDFPANLDEANDKKHLLFIYKVSQFNLIKV